MPWGRRALYAINIPSVQAAFAADAETMLAALLYLGAGVGMLLTGLVQRGWPENSPRPPPSPGRSCPYTRGHGAAGHSGPILLMLGISRTSPANVSLLNNFEIIGRLPDRPGGVPGGHLPSCGWPSDCDPGQHSAESGQEGSGPGIKGQC